MRAAFARPKLLSRTESVLFFRTESVLKGGSENQKKIREEGSVPWGVGPSFRHYECLFTDFLLSASGHLKHGPLRLFAADCPDLQFTAQV